MKRIIFPGLALYTLFSGLGLFLGPGLSSPLLIPWASGFLFLTFTISYYLLFGKTIFLSFESLILCSIALNFLIQVTGGPASAFHALYFPIAASAAFLPRLRSYAVVAIAILIQGGNLIVSGRHAEYGWLPYTAFAVSLAGVVLITAPFINRIRKHARISQDRYKKLLADAKAVDPLADDRTIEALSEQNRRAANINTAFEREGSFKGLISMIYEMVPAHTYALFLADRDGGVFVLRAIRSQSSQAATGGEVEISRGSGLLGIAVDKNAPQYLPDMVIPAKNLGYYIHDVPVKSLLTIPVSQGERIAGLLVVDSLERNAFSPDNQDLLVRFAPFFSEIIEKVRISQELDLRAKNFAALHEMSAILSSSLEIGDVLDKLTGQIRAVVPFDYCVFLHYEEATADMVIRSVRGYDPKFIGNRFPPDKSAILFHMLNEWQERSSAKIHYDPDLGSRSKDISLFPIKEMQKPVLSLYGRPLIAQNRFIGAVFLSSIRSNAFSEYHRNFLDMLFNQVAMVLDNSIMHQNIRNMARTDGLTGLLNHRTFMGKLAEEYKRIDREHRPFSLLLMDIDKFKSVNDSYGHPVGDIAIKAVATVLKETVRATDFVARYGGEEFAVGMVDTNNKGAEQMAERVRHIMEKTVVTRIGSRQLMITLSIGVSSFPQDTRNMTELIALADNALYKAKRLGRNRVCLAKDAGDTDGVFATSPIK